MAYTNYDSGLLKHVSNDVCWQSMGTGKTLKNIWELRLNHINKSYFTAVSDSVDLNIEQGNELGNDCIYIMIYSSIQTVHNIDLNGLSQDF